MRPLPGNGAAHMHTLEPPQVDGYVLDSQPDGRPAAVLVSSVRSRQTCSWLLCKTTRDKPADLSFLVRLRKKKQRSCEGHSGLRAPSAAPIPCPSPVPIPPTGSLPYKTEPGVI